MNLPDGCTTRVILVRHGQSNFNQQARFQGSSNEPCLTKKGWATAAQCGVYLSGIQFDGIFCSPLWRAEETAKAMRSAFLQQGRHPAAIVSDNRLREVHLPGWEGLSFSTVRELYPASFQLWQEQPHLLELPVDTGPPGSGSFSPLKDACTRSQQFWDDTLLTRRGQTLLVVGHGAAISTMLCMVLGIQCANIHRLQQSNGGISALEVCGSTPDKVRILFLNRTQHLGERLPKIKGSREGVRIVLLTRECANSFAWDTALKGEAASSIEGDAVPELLAERFRNATPGKLNTVAWIVPEGRLRSQDIQSLRLNMLPDAAWHIDGKTITVLHYPRQEAPPVLQAMNIAATHGAMSRL